MKTLSLALLLLLSADAALAATYYVSNQGADHNDGLSPQSAWATLQRVNAGSFQPGDKILFRRNDVWRGQLIPHGGSQAGHVVYADYGKGAKPLLLGSVSKSRPKDWTAAGNGIWSADGFQNDVGNIVFDDGKACGVKRWHESDLRRDGDYWYDAGRHLVKLRSAENPAKHYARIECAIREHVLLQLGRSYIVYENLAVKYGGAHGLGAAAAHHTIVRGCDLGFIGGGDQMGDGRQVRFGNGIEFWAAAHDNLVERCRLWEIYDAALTNQSMGPATPQYNITYRDNVIWNSEYSFEYWNRPEDSETHNVYFLHNTCVNAGYGWGHAQRPDPSGCHLRFYSSPAPARNIVVRNNIFDGATGPAFYAPQWSRAQIDSLSMDHNCWYQPEGVMIALKGSGYTMRDFAKYQAAWRKESSSICAAAGFVDAGRRDFHLTAGSPCIDAGSDDGIRRDFDGTPVPQGRAPDLGAYEFEAQ
jgi:hypothetical protein